MPTTDLQDANICIPSSTQTCTFLTITPNRVDKGYDSYRNIGPSFESVEGEVEMIKDEDEVVPVVS